MLQSLRIRNLALLEEAAMEFEAGFTAVTGETGAGKSILIGGLSLLAGERADKTVIRQGAPSCEVEAALFFAQPGRIDAALAELGLPPAEEGRLVLKRSLSRDQAPRISVNDRLATLGALQRLAGAWIDFHGPNEPRRLLQPACQLELLDLFGRAGPALEAYRRAYGAWQSLRAERERTAGEARLPDDQVEFLRARLAKMEGLDLSDEAVDALERDFSRLSRASELIEMAEGLAAGLTGEEGLQGRLSALLRQARRLAELDPASRGLAERLGSAAVELNELGAEFSDLGRRLQIDPEQASSLTERMNAWLEIKRRCGGRPESARAARDDLRRRLEAQRDLDGTLERLDRETAAAEKDARREAAALRRIRERAADELSRAAAREIARLGFQKAGFEARLVPLDRPGPSGDCACEFLFSPNVGEPPLPLHRIASSGELARVMLGLKTLLADLDAVPLLVFDEVDANVGGEIGRAVGERMAAIARRHQVLCVTHLPQVAARASAHWVVQKDQSGSRAVVAIAPIHASRRARLTELARMLGDRGAKSALAHAEELLRA